MLLAHLLLVIRSKTSGQQFKPASSACWQWILRTVLNTENNLFFPYCIMTLSLFIWKNDWSYKGFSLCLRDLLSLFPFLYAFDCFLIVYIVEKAMDLLHLHSPFSFMPIAGNNSHRKVTGNYTPLSDWKLTSSQ